MTLDTPTPAAMEAARMVYDRKPRDVTDAYEIAKGLWPRAETITLMAVARLAMFQAAKRQRKAAPVQPHGVSVTSIKTGKVRQPNNEQEAVNAPLPEAHYLGRVR